MTMSDGPLARVDERVIESLVERGDVSGLAPAERARYYVQLCQSLGLSAAAQPLAYLKLNGKEVLYATRGATDQLAAIHKLNREIIEGPKVIDLAGTKLVYAVCRATHPNGRVETATATVPLVDPMNVLMKAETKAKRRATLSILGLGILDECELETIPAHARETPRGALGGGEAQPGAEPEPLRLVGVEAPGRSLVDDLVAELESRPTLTAIAQSWQVARSDVAQWAESDRNRVWKAAVARAVGLGSTQTALRAEIARLSTPPPDGTSGPARGPAERAAGPAASEASGGAGEATAVGDARGRGETAPGPRDTSTALVVPLRAWTPVTTSTGVVIDTEEGAREHLRSLNGFGLEATFARHETHVGWTALVVEAWRSRWGGTDEGVRAALVGKAAERRAERVRRAS